MLAAVVAALTQPGNWRPRLPPASNQSVSLVDAGRGRHLVLHPFGGLEVSQKVAPLRIDIQHFGLPCRPGAFRIVDVVAGGSAAVPRRYARSSRPRSSSR